ncbi:MAG: beta-phosphoglucomutase [Acidobacteriota bacterium]|jgi:HAD superfamily hydrolase (TIGR01509 family)|nr:beta-phosphoglucomutase [Acidobacteriota bacterium]
MIRAILFDYNGVIINDEPLHLEAYREVLQTEGVGLTDSEYYDCLGMDDVTFARAAFSRVGREASDDALHALIERKTGRYVELIKDELPLCPGVVTFVKACARQWQLAIVSMARRVEIEPVLERASLAQSFVALVTAEDVRACKPDPAGYLRGLELLNEKSGAASQSPLAASECLVIEDSPAGIKSARAAGMRTLGVTNTVAESRLRAAGADVVTHSLADWTPDAVYHVFSKR